MKFLILSLLLFLNYRHFNEPKQSDEEVFNTIVELDKLLLIHNKTLSDYEKIEPKECEFPILVREDLLTFYKQNNSKVKIIYKLNSWRVILTIKENSLDYLIVMD